MLYGHHIWSDVPLQFKNDDDLHEGHPKIIKGQIVNHAIWLSNFVRSTNESIGDNHVLNRGQMLIEVKRSKVRFMTTSLRLKHHQTIKMVTVTLTNASA